MAPAECPYKMLVSIILTQVSNKKNGTTKTHFHIKVRSNMHGFVWRCAHSLEFIAHLANFRLDSIYFDDKMSSNPRLTRCGNQSPNGKTRSSRLWQNVGSSARHLSAHVCVCVVHCPKCGHTELLSISANWKSMAKCKRHLYVPSINLESHRLAGIKSYFQFQFLCEFAEQPDHGPKKRKY